MKFTVLLAGLDKLVGQ